jgi:hypothetical protein
MMIPTPALKNPELGSGFGSAPNRSSIRFGRFGLLSGPFDSEIQGIASSYGLSA